VVAELAELAAAAHQELKARTQCFQQLRQLAAVSVKAIPVQSVQVVQAVVVEV
jgi:hypothetical protein